jgi:hypothetical protein
LQLFKTNSSILLSSKDTLRCFDWETNN